MVILLTGGAIPVQGITVSGTITNNDTGQGVSGVSAVLFDLVAKQGYSAGTDTAGAYSIDVPASVYDINIAPSEAGLIGRSELNVEIRQNIVKNYALSRGFTISGTVTRADTNQPLADVFVGVLNPDTQQDYGSLTDDAGRYSFSVTAGRYEFHATHTANLNWTTYVEANFTVTSNVNKNVILGTGVTIRGRVTRSDTNEAVVNAFVFYFDKVTRQGYGFPTDINGNYAIVLPTGTYALNVQPPLGSNLTRPIDLVVNVTGDMSRDIILAPGITLSGRITRSDTGAGVVGANVGIVNLEGEGFGTYTDSNGNYSLGVLPGSYIFHADLPESQLVPYDEFSFVITESRVKNVALSQGIMVSGTVTRRDTGEPLEGALIHLFNSTLNQGATSHTDSDGRYVIAVLPGKYIFTVNPPEASDLDLEQGFKILDISGDTVNNVVLDAGFTVSGRVAREDTGEPVAFALVGVRDIATQKGGGSLTDLNGEYRFSVKAGTYQVIVEPPRGSGLVSILQQNLVISSPVVRNFILRGGFTVQGTVRRNDTNQPVADAFVGLINQSSGLFFGSQTGANGSYSFGAPQGSYQFVAVPPEGSDLAMYVEMEGKTPRPFIITGNVIKDVPLSPGMTLQGTVTRSDTNQPVSGALVGVFDPETGRGAGGETMENGHYSFSITPGTYILHVEPPAGSRLMSQNEFNLVIESNTVKNVTLSGGVTVSGTVTRRDTNQPVSGAFVGMFNPVTLRGSGTESDANGEYSFAVQVGTYNIHVEPPEGSGLTSYNELDVTVSTDLNKDISLGRGITVSGRVTRSDNNQPVIGAFIGMFNPATLQGGGAQSSANGEYSFVIQPGTYNIHVEPPEGSGLISHDESNITVNADLSKDIPLSRGVTVHGRVTRGDNNQPVSSAFIAMFDPLLLTQGFGAQSDANGDYSFVIKPGTYSMHVEPPTGSGLASYDEFNVAVNADLLKNIILQTGTGTSGGILPNVTIPPGFTPPPGFPTLQRTLHAVETPSITISSPFDGQSFTSANITVFGSAGSGAGVSKVEVKVGNVSYFLATGTTTWNANVTLSPGSNTITVRVTDRNNVINTTSATVTYSQFELPSVTISSPLNGQIFTSANITVLGTASSIAGVSKVEVKAGNGSYVLATGTLSWSASVAMSPGSNTITVKVTDLNNNINTASVTVTYSQFALPSITISAPFNGQSFTNSSITIRGTALSSSTAVSRVDVKVGNGSYVLAAGTSLWSAALALNQGTNTITARVTDTSGNTNTDSVVVFYSTTTGIISRYDANGNGKIERGEAVKAVVDFFSGAITRQDAINVVITYFTG